jgi:5-methylcytosine-specific restriction protein B
VTTKEVGPVDGIEPRIRGYRRWALPLLRVLEELGGSGTPVAVEARIRETLKDALTDGQWATVVRGNYVRWARHSFQKAGLLDGKKGIWALSPAGRQWLDEHHDEPLPSDWNVAEMSPEEAGDLNAELETVTVTEFEGYEVPVLRLLERGALDKQEIYDRLSADIGAQLLPGDLRVMPRGRPVWQYRTSWALSNLKKEGAIRNPTTARWELTEVGRARLKQESQRWSLKPFQQSKASVRALAGGGSIAVATPGGASALAHRWPTSAWRSLAALFPELALAVEQRIRPDLTPSPQPAVARNVVFYGPPGTGKTFVARKIALALTGMPDPGPDSRWRVVQFHPSYSYEDFVQGLRPALDATDLQYRLIPGPFFQLCKAAESDPDHFYVLIVDEINRGDPARIFGELLYALEYRGEAIEIASGGELTVPPNLVILGTMNSVDRSVALVDYALRRRFAFVRVDPNPQAITHSTRLGGLLEGFNEWLVSQLDADHALGHSFFLNPALPKPADDSVVERIWEHDVRPLLEEYFFGQPERLKRAAKVWKETWAEADDDDDDDDEVEGDDAG